MSCCRHRLMLGQRNYRLLHNLDHGLCRWYLCSDKATCFHFHSVHSHNILQHFPCVPMTTGQTGCGSGIQQIGHLAGRGLCRDKIRISCIRYHAVMPGYWLHSQICGEIPEVIVRLLLAWLVQFSWLAVTKTLYCCSQRS